MTDAALHSRLDHLLGLYQAKGLDVASGLRPAATDTEMAEVEEAVGAALPDEVRALWTWHNGWDEATGADPFWFRDNFLVGTPEVPRLREILSYYEDVDEGFDLARVVPVATLDGSIYAVSTGPQTAVAGHAHPVIQIYHDIEPYFHSVTTMVETAIAWVSEPDYDHYDCEKPWIREHWNRINPDLPR